MTEIDEALDAIPDLSEQQILLLIEYQRQEMAAYKGSKTKAKKDQSEEDLMSTMDMFVKSAQAVGPPATEVGKAGFKRRF